MGYSSANAQLLTVPPYAVGCLGTILVGIYSDKYQLRGPFIIGGSTVALIGYVILYTRGTAGVGYVGTILAAVGAFPTIAPNLAWAGGNAGGVTKRGVVLALVIGLSNLGGCVFFMIPTTTNWPNVFVAYVPRSYISTPRTSTKDTEQF